jgi:hypothetical protein
MHYPGKFNNDSKGADQIHKDKFVINQPAGNIEFVNTKDAESVTITHKSGSSSKLDKFGADILVTRDKREHVMGDVLSNINGSKTEIIEESEEKIVLGDVISSIGDTAKWVEPMQQIKAAQRELHDKKRLFEVKRSNKHNTIDQAPNQTKSGSHAKCPTSSNTSKLINASSATTVSNVRVGSRDVINVQDGGEEFKIVSGGGGNRCLTCWGKLISPSSQDGKWANELEKQQIIKTREEIQKKIYDYEKHLGQNKCPNGGSHIETIAKHFIQNIGLVFNDFESFRRDPIGKLVPSGVKIDPLGTTIYTQYRESPLVEAVDVERFPGGSYELNICDGWIVTVGSNGIDFKTTGPLNLFGTMVNIVGEQVALGARGDFTIEAPRVDITGEVITIRPKKLKRTLETGGDTEEEQQLLIDGNLNVGLNAVIRGGAHIEGELSVHHITAPCEYHITETDFTYGTQIEPMEGLPDEKCPSVSPGTPGIHIEVDPSECNDSYPKSPTYATLLPGTVIGYAIGKDSRGDEHCLPVYSIRSENFAVVDKHQHYFKNIACKLFEGGTKVEASAGSVSGSGTANPHDAIRAVGARNNWTKPVLAKPVKNSKTQHTVTQKFAGGCENLSINKTDWGDSAQEDSLPIGEGVRTSNYTDAIVQQKIKSLEAQLEANYNELKKAMSDLSKLKD